MGSSDDEIPFFIDLRAEAILLFQERLFSFFLNELLKAFFADLVFGIDEMHNNIFWLDCNKIPAIMNE